MQLLYITMLYWDNINSRWKNDKILNVWVKYNGLITGWNDYKNYIDLLKWKINE